MKTALKVSTVLSWFNLIVWGLIVVFGLLAALTFQSFPMLVVTFVLSVIILHSYAALKLRKSIMNPAIPLSSQTPIGIRFVGVIASFIGILYLLDGIAILQNPEEYLKLIQDKMTQFKGTSIPAIRAGAAIAFVLGASIAVNVFLNFRLLRWYFFVRGNGIK